MTSLLINKNELGRKVMTSFHIKLNAVNERITPNLLKAHREPFVESID